MQRSSTLLLGPEDGWEDEAMFYRVALRSIAGGATWYHIASVQGIDRHLRRPGSRFPLLTTARTRLVDLDGVVGVGLGDRAAPVKEVPPERPGHDLKIDRQARLLLVDYGGVFEAVNVVDVGDRQCSVHCCGPFARDLFELCVEFWHACPPLTWPAFDRCGWHSIEPD
jgi:hypothetical protein